MRSIDVIKFVEVFRNANIMNSMNNSVKVEIFMSVIERMKSNIQREVNIVHEFNICKGIFCVDCPFGVHYPSERTIIKCNFVLSRVRMHYPEKSPMNLIEMTEDFIKTASEKSL